MKSALRIFLALAGLAATGIGLSLLLDPTAFEANAGLQLAPDPRLLSEFRAQGAGLAVAGLFMCVGAAWRRFTRPALALAAALYSAYGVARLVGFAADGLPGETLMTVAAVELALGAAAIVFFATSARLEAQPG